MAVRDGGTVFTSIVALLAPSGHFPFPTPSGNGKCH